MGEEGRGRGRKGDEKGEWLKGKGRIRGREEGERWGEEGEKGEAMKVG